MVPQVRYVALRAWWPKVTDLDMTACLRSLHSSDNMGNKDRRLPQKPVGQLAWSTQCNLKLQERLCLKQRGTGGYL